MHRPLPLFLTRCTSGYSHYSLTRNELTHI